MKKNIADILIGLERNYLNKQITKRKEIAAFDINPSSRIAERKEAKSQVMLICIFVDLQRIQFKVTQRYVHGQIATKIREISSKEKRSNCILMNK